MTERALVIGCGGTIGGAWTVAALDAVAQALDWDPRDAAVAQGTSAGAELVTLLAAGFSTADLVAWQAGTATDPALRQHLADTPPSLPPLPAPRLLHPGTLTRRGPDSHGGHRRVSGLAPRGRGDAAWLDRLATAALARGATLPSPAARLVAFEPATGARIAFGAPGSPVATASEALRASWAIPGWMPPVVIDGRTFVDGGAASTASVDLIGPDDADEIIAIVSMASAPGVRGPGVGGAAEYQLLRRPMSALFWAEVAQVRARGTRVTVIAPTAAELAAVGPNFMNRARRAAAFAAAQRSAPETVARALAAA